MPARLFPEGDPSPAVAKLSELEAGRWGDCFAVLVTKDRATTRDGKPYFRVGFRDAVRSVTAMIWSDTPHFADCEQAWEPGKFYKLRCRYQETQFGPQIDLDRIREVTDADAADGFDPADYAPASRFNADEMFDELREIVSTQIDEGPLQQLVSGILDDYAEEIKTYPAASRNHHAYRAGYLEHVLSVTRTAVYLADKYIAYYNEMQPPLSKSLVVAGAVLHDIGKMVELEPRLQGGVYTTEGRLIGHILLGRDLVRDKAQEVPDLDAETRLRLEHIIVAHQNLPEWGSPIAPHTPEALLVHFADDIDAKFHMMAVALETEPTGEDFTGRDNPLRRSIFRGGTSSEDE